MSEDRVAEDEQNRINLISSLPYFIGWMSYWGIISGAIIFITQKESKARFYGAQAGILSLIWGIFCLICGKSQYNYSPFSIISRGFYPLVAIAVAIYFIYLGWKIYKGHQVQVSYISDIAYRLLKNL